MKVLNISVRGNSDGERNSKMVWRDEPRFRCICPIESLHTYFGDGNATYSNQPGLSDASASEIKYFSLTHNLSPEKNFNPLPGNISRTE